MQNTTFEEIEIEQSSSAQEALAPAENVTENATEDSAQDATESSAKVVLVVEDEITSLGLEATNVSNKYSEVAADSEPQKAAISVVDVEYRYPRNYLLSDVNSILKDPLMRKQNPPVLEKISISAPRGKIYALLGSSGCGKTTLLKCILGRLRPSGGRIRLFGRAPGSKHCPVPGAGVGYMPQELALFPDFTITETLRYFGQLYRMSSEEIKARSAYIVAFLNLPTKNRVVKQLSGGQQRRVSLSCALLHSPPLLVLDEPTVGVDPLLRAAIWTHLESLCAKQQTTILITTHYIEEARGATTIGLMRNGRLLVQSDPEVLLAQHGLPRLEDVFLKLCVLQDTQIEEQEKQKRTQNPSDQTVEETNVDADVEVVEKKVVADYDHNGNLEKKKTKKQLKGEEEASIDPSQPTFQTSSTLFDPYRFNALFMKNTIRLRRNLPITLFYCLIPALQFGLFILTAGRTPTNLPVAIVNEEMPPDLTAKFLSYLAPGSMIATNLSSLEEAEKLVVDGKAWAVLHFGSNFSTALDDRRIELAAAENETIEASNIHLYLDMSNHIVGLAIIQNIFLAFRSLMSDFLSTVGYNPNSLATPIEITEIVYGSMDLSSMMELMTPGIIILIAFFSTAAVTGLALILERKDGLLERSLVAGMRPFECLISHVFTQMMVLVSQQVVLFITIFYVFEVASRGPIGWVFLMCFLQGCAGIMYGLLISAVCPDEVTGAIITMGSLLPTIFISGIFWPVSSIAWWLYWVSLLLPQTLAMDSIRAILSRGWSIDHWDVQLGFGTTMGWVLFYMLLAVFTFNKIVA